ncbi:MAG TPA: EAL domain-containing protein [Mycobacteriales bacterium]|nr:EAL domain-containing protein [Mycobacteriales bacterium]
MPLSEELERTVHTRELIQGLLAQPRQLGPDYQPIHLLTDDTLVGFKATGRGAPGTELGDTLSLLDGARSLGFVERIDFAFRALAVEDMLAHPELELHLTPEPETYGAPCPPRFAGLMGRANRELSIAAEIHAEAFADGVKLDAGLAEIREWGWQVVLTDVADDDTALSRAHVVRPDVVQVDLRLPGRAARSAPVARLLKVADSFGARVMALGVDTPTARDVAESLGATLARGARYGAPGPLPNG